MHICACPIVHAYGMGPGRARGLDLWQSVHAHGPRTATRARRENDAAWACAGSVASNVQCGEARCHGAIVSGLLVTVGQSAAALSHDQ